MRATILVCALAAGAASVTLSDARAEGEPYGCACLHNKTQHVVKFRYKWGNGDWKSDHLRAGFQETLCWRYGSGPSTSPPLSFQIDVDLTNGAAWTTYNLPRVQSQTNRCESVGQKFHYDIDYRPNTNRQYLHMTHR
jgi:hypothetical protein